MPQTGVRAALAELNRLKTYRKLDAIRTRRLPKVWLHVALSLLAMAAAAVVNSQAGIALARKCVA